MPTNDHKPELHVRHEHVSNPDAPGYEVTDVNINGIVVFLSGLVGPRNGHELAVRRPG